MAQGTIKAKSKPSLKPSRGAHGITKKGSRSIAPKKAALAKQQKLTKKLSAGLTAKTEKMLGEKAGHLEMLSGGKKERKKNEDSKSKKEPATNSATKKNVRSGG